MTMERDSVAMLVNSWTVPVSCVDGVLAERTGDRKSNMFILDGALDAWYGDFSPHLCVGFLFLILYPGLLLLLLPPPP